MKVEYHNYITDCYTEYVDRTGSLIHEDHIVRVDTILRSHLVWSTIYSAVISLSRRELHVILQYRDNGLIFRSKVSFENHYLTMVDNAVISDHIRSAFLDLTLQLWNYTETPVLSDTLESVHKEGIDKEN